jgi:hypothetical protein
VNLWPPGSERTRLDRIPLGTTVMIGTAALQIDHWEWDSGGTTIKVFFKGREHPGLYQGMPTMTVWEPTPDPT